MKQKVRFSFRLKFIALVSLVVAFTGASSLIYSTVILRGQVIEAIQIRVAVMAATGASQIRGEDVRALRKPEDFRKPEYARVYAALKDIYLANLDHNVKLDNIYIIRKNPADPAGKDLIFAAHLPGDNKYEHGLAPIASMAQEKVNYIGNDVSYDILPEMSVIYDEGRRSSFTDIYEQPPWGAWVSGFAPIKTVDGEITGLLEVDYDLNFIESYLASQVLKESAAVGVVLLIAIALSILLAGSFSKPVHALGAAVNAFAAGDYSRRVHLNRSDEFELLGRHFNDMAQSVEEKLHLSKYVSPETLSRVSGDSTHGVAAGARKRLVCFFSDIRGFTSFSEKNEVEAVIRMLNDLLQRQTEIIGARGGTIDKFVGDEVMATFSGDGALARAMDAGCAIQQELNKLPEGIAVGIGIHAGEVIQGDIGSSARKDFTVIGPTVNLAARLCAAAGGGEVLITEDCLADLPDEFITKAEAEELRFKGFDHDIAVRRVTGRR